MKTLGRNADNDLYLEGGKLAVLHDVDAQAQIIEAALLTQQGELQFDEEGGIDYFGTVLLKPNLINFWAGLVRSRVETFSFVKKVEDFQYKFDRAKSTLLWSMVVVNTDGAKIVLKDKATAIDGKPGIDVKWDDIYDKPIGVEDSLGFVEGMQFEAENLGVPLNPSTSNLRETKDVLNRVLFGPIDEEYKKKWSVRFSFSGVPIGAVINFSNLLIDIANNAAPDAENPHYSPFVVDISDGFHFRSDATGIEPEEYNNEVWFKDENGNVTQKHTIKKGGDVTISIRGNIAAIKTLGWEDSSESTSLDTENAPLPIFLDAQGAEPFAYLTGISVGENVPLSSIGPASFCGMSNLYQIEWSSRLNGDITIGDFAFADCSSLSDLQWIPSQTSSVGTGCFMGCSNLKSLKGFENVKPIVGSTVGIPPVCFSNCTQLTAVEYLSEEIKVIGAEAFSYCKSLASIDGLPDSITTIEDQAFIGCDKLTTILYLPESLRTIGNSAFAECPSLSSLYIPDNVTHIGKRAFAGCTALNNILSEAGSTPPIIEDDTIPVTEGLKIFVPASYLTKYLEKWGSNYDIRNYGVYTFTLSGESGILEGDTLLGSTGVLVSDSIWAVSFGDGEKEQRFTSQSSQFPAYTYKSAHAEVSVVIKGYVRRISAVSPSNYPFLTTEAGAAFDKLTAVTIADSPLEMIGDFCFAQCTNLQSVTYTGNNTAPYCLGTRTFWGCESLVTTSCQRTGLGLLKTEDGQGYYPAFGEACFYQSGIATLDYAREGVTSLPAYCFAGTAIPSLEGIQQPEGIEEPILKELGDHCFYGCTKLSRIYELQHTGVTTLPEYCFASCTNLTNIDGIQNIVSEKHLDAKEESEVDNRMGTHVFEGCTALNDISALADAREITDLPDYTFSGCTDLTAIAGFKYIKSLGEYCFSGCTGLTDISGLMDAVTSAEEEEPLLTTIPRYCFTGCTGLKTLIGCWDIDTIEEGAFSNCTGLMSITGLGKRIVTIGNLAFQNCTGLLYVGTVAATVPTLSATAFNGVQVAGLTLYVQENLVASFAKATGWSVFGRVTSRTIKVTIDNAETLSSEDQSCVKVACDIGTGENTVKGMWFVDFGDGNGFRHYYGCETEVIPAPQKIKYENRNSRTITFFGDIAEIWSGDYSYDPSESLDESDSMADRISPLLGNCSEKATAVTVSSTYLQKIGDFCFYNYGESSELGNTNPLAVSITMANGGEIGAFAFAKEDGESIHGPIGEIATCNASILGPGTFYNSGLTSLSAFSSVSTAGEYAFASNPGITSLAGLSLLSSISEGLFKDCTGITDTNGISAATSIGEHAFLSCTGLTTVKGLSSSLKEIKEGAFSGCKAIKKVFMVSIEPPTLATNGFENTVYDNAILYVPAGKEGVYSERQGWKKFNHIRTRYISFALKGIRAGDKIATGMGLVSATGPWTISYGKGETTRTFEAGVVTLPSYTFQKDGDKEIMFSGPVVSIRCAENAYPFLAQKQGANPWLETIVGSEDQELTEFGDYVFAGCTSLKSINTMPTITSIGGHAFENATALVDVSGLTGVTSIGGYAFSGCSALTGLYGLHAVSTIGERAFNGCSRLETIDGLGVNVTSIGDYAFASCPLQEVQMFAATPPTLATTSFAGLDLTKIPLYVRSKSISDYSAAISWSLFSNIRSRYVEFTLTGCPANITVDGGVGKILANTYVVVDWDSTHSSGMSCKSDASVLLPSYTYSLSGNHTFRLEGDVIGIAGAAPEEDSDSTDSTSVDAEPLSFVSLSINGAQTADGGKSYVSKLLTSTSSSEYSALATLAKYSFYGNAALASANFSALTTIGDGAFAYDTSLTSTELLQKVTTIGDYAFYGCTGLTEITSLDSIMEIGNYAFAPRNVNLKSVQCGISANAQGKVQIKLGVDPFGEITSPIDAYLYVPMDSIEAYQADDAIPWKYFNVASQVISFTMEDVPSGTIIAGLSGNNSVGNAKVTVEGAWSIDWGDGSAREVMPETQTSFSEHTYEYNANVSYPPDLEWYSKTEDGVTTWYIRSVTVSISGAFSEIGVQSPNTRPFIGVAGTSGNPYLKSVAASPSLELTAIGDNTFQNCSALVHASGFTNVETIGAYAFSGCTRLSDLGDETSCFLAAKTIGAYAFAGCTSLTGLAAFPHVLNIGVRAFSGCESITSTLGLGAGYAGTPCYTVYSLDLRLTVNEEIPDNWTWMTAPGTYTFEDIERLYGKVQVDTAGWKVFRQMTIDRNRYVVGIEWDNNVALNPAFGSYAFEGCTFSSINMEAFEAPPSIQTTTFTVSPEAVVVYVPAATKYVAPVELYRNAPGWKAFFSIIASSSLSFTFEVGSLHGPDEIDAETMTDSSGTGICGLGNVLFTGSNFSIDWGDGSEEQKITGTKQDMVYTAKFPSHAYDEGFKPTGLVTIKLLGNITGFTGIMDGTVRQPLFAVCNWTRTYAISQAGEKYLSSIEPIDLDYSKVISADIGSNAPIATIGKFSFIRCSNLKQVTFKRASSPTAEKLALIGESAFEGCESLEWFTNENGMADSSSIGSKAFYQCAQLQGVAFLKNCATIGSSAFEGCSNQNFTTLRPTIGGKQYGLDSVVSIGISAFKGCTGLKDINLPATVTAVCDSAFEGCTGVSSILWEEADSALPDEGEIKIGARSFYGCSNSSKQYIVSIPSQVHQIGTSAFALSGMQSFTWGYADEPASPYTYQFFTDMPDDNAVVPGIFEGCARLTTVSIYHSISVAPYRLFCRCKNLVSYNGSGFTTINPYAFFGCEHLTKDSFSALVAPTEGTLGDYAFARCLALENITIPYAVNKLGEGCFSRSDEAFYKGSTWGNHTIDESVPKFYNISAFEDWMSQTYGWKRMDVWSVYDSIIYPSGSASTNGMTVSWGKEVDGNWVSPSGASVGIACFMNCVNSDVEWSRFPSIVQVPAYCFYNCSNLFLGKNLSELPSTISYFGRFALARTAMRTLGRGTGTDENGTPVFAQPISASMAPALFFGCTELKTLGGNDEFPTDGLVKLFSTIPSAFPDACFYGCSQLANVNALAGDLRSVSRLGKYCFAKCIELAAGDPTVENTQSITYAMDNIVQIGDGCFMGCSGLTGEFYGLPRVAYYPYLSFFGCGMTDIIALYSYYDESDASSTDEEESSGIPDVQVTLEGDSFGGMAGIQSINLPYSSYMVKIVSAGTYEEGGIIHYINDPFSGIPNKGSVTLTVPNEVVNNYYINAYWREFTINTSYDGMPLAMVISMDISNEPDPEPDPETGVTPPNPRTITGFGKIMVDTTVSNRIAIEWEDGIGTRPYVVSDDGTFDMTAEGISYTYEYLDNVSRTRPVTMKIYGAITGFEGAADSATSSIIANKTVVPLFYTAIRDETSNGSGVPRIAENTWFRSVLFYSELETIGDGSFGYCTQMLPPMIPPSVKKIGKNAFFGCDQIRDLNFLNSNIEELNQYCFAYCDNLTDYSNFWNLTKLTAIPAGCFAKTKSIPDEGDLDWIPDGVNEIGFAAFQHVCFKHFNLRKRSGDSTIVRTDPITIRNYAFRYNTSLVNFLNSDDAGAVSGIKLKLTGTNAFRDCTGLTSLNGISLDSSITAIPVGTFRECTSLSDISALSSNTRIVAVGDGAFYKTNLSSLQNLPTSITTIGSYPATPDTDGKFNSNVGGAFAFCANLTSLHGMPTSVSFLGREAFRGCSALEDLGYAGADSGMPTALETIGPKCFIGCTAIGHIKLNRYDSPDGITGLGDVIRDSAIEDAVFEYVTLNQKQSFYVSTPSGSDSAYKDVWAKNSGTQESPIYLRFNPSKINPTP